MPRPVPSSSAPGSACRVHVPALRAAGFDVVALVGRDAAKTARAARRARSRCPSALHGARRGARARRRRRRHDRDAARHARRARDRRPRGPASTCSARSRSRWTRPRPTAMLDAAEDAGVTHLVGHEFRWATERAVVGRAIADGAIGEPRLATLVQYVPLVADPTTRVPDWWFDAARGGGWLGASGSHVVDQVRVVARRVRGGERDACRSCRRAPASRRTRSPFGSGSRPASRACCSRRPRRGGRCAGITTVAGTDGTVWIDGDEAWVADRRRRARLPRPRRPRAARAARARATTRGTASRTSSSAPTRGCARRCAPASRARPVRAPVPVPTFADGVGRDAGARRDPRASRGVTGRRRHRCVRV